MSGQTYPERAASGLVRESNALAVLVLLASPGGLAVQLSGRDSVGFYLIALVGAAGHVALRRMSERDRSVEIDLSRCERGQAVVLLAVLVGGGATMISLRLGVGVAVGELVTTSVGKSLLAVFGPALTPLIDYRLGERHRWLSPSRLAAAGLIQLLVVVVGVKPDTARTLQSDAPRVDPM